ncbi:MAG: cytochrome P460 family protein [Gemmatimonadetes bacterium]|nr:cytochrome P460 family protein [Gemmatimonadota bacterium]
MLPRWIGLAVAASVVTFAATGCERRPPEREAEVQPAAAPEPQLPDTTGAVVWAYLQQVNYRQNWNTWPGKGTLYKGQEPHGALLTTYLNPLAHDALTNKAGKLSAGAIVVKENYAPDSTLAAITIMYKVAGYNAEASDWFWLKTDPNGVVDVQGRVGMCQSCHGAKKDNDYIMTASLK